MDKMTPELAKYLEEKGLALKCPTRRQMREYTKDERPLVYKASDESLDPEVRAEALDGLMDRREDLLKGLYPDQDVLAMPADLFADLFSAVMEKAQGNARGN
jgi:hypothetical protein